MIKPIQMLLWMTLAAGFATPVSAAEAQRFNQIRFQVQASEAVANDRMQAVLAVQDEDADAARLADRINKTMTWALAQARGPGAVQGAVKGAVKVRSGGYTTQPVYRKEALESWRASQELVLHGADFAEIGRLIGVLQQRLQLRAVSFSVARETREAAERALIDGALDGFKRRAEQVRSNLGTKAYRIVELNINTEDMPVQPLPMMRAQLMSESVAAPAFAGGESEVRVSVHGLIQLD
ncbi:MAG: SIMPL domain-containing protein [Gammaproteobacteria bacterium]